MLYEISNKLSNHKYTEYELKFKHPFSQHVGRGKNKTKRTCYLVQDDPEILCGAYKYGFSMKPHAFKIDGVTETKQPWVNCVILDFDNLTKQQCLFVKSIVEGKYDFMPEGKQIFGDWSSGMKTTILHNSGIPNGISKWKYKVFFPTLEPTLCVYEDVDRAFRVAVSFFNPTFSMDEVNVIWEAWKKANNRKNKISNPMFNGWILPDVQMLNAFRTQVTFSINTNQKEQFVEIDDDNPMFRRLGCSSKYPVTSKLDYVGLDWKVNKAVPRCKDMGTPPTKEQIEEIYNQIQDNCHFPYSDYSLPTTKASFAQLVGKTHFDDLVLPSRGIAKLNAARWSQIHNHQMNVNHDLEELMKDANYVSKTFARIYAELRFQGQPSNFKVQALEDCCTALKLLHGPKLFDDGGYLTKRQLHDMMWEMASAFMNAWNAYKWWRVRQKMLKTIVNHRVYELRDIWRQSHSNEDFKAYVVELNKDIMARYNEAKNTKMPYDYHRFGFKKEIIEGVLVPGQIKLNSPSEFMSRMRLEIVVMKDGNYSDKLLTQWFYQYRALWNKTYPQDAIGRKEHKPHKSKYDELFKDMTREQIAEYINTSDLSPNMKSRLRKEHGIHMRNRR